MKREQFVSVIIHHIHDWLDQTEIQNWIKSLPDVVQVSRRKCYRESKQFDLILNFKPGVDPFALMGVTTLENSTVTFDHKEFKVYPLAEPHDLNDCVVIARVDLSSPSPCEQNTIPSRNSLKLDKLSDNDPECSVCRDVLVAPFSTPCWTCTRAVCHDCLLNHFRSAQKDFERFPAKCCEAAYHPDVAKGVLPEAELLKYKTHFEEWLAPQPFYCPTPTCSTFIPLRQLRLHEDNVVECHVCQASICVACKQKAHKGQTCTDATRENEDLKMLTKFGYKQCPRCGIAVGKMYGCSHIQCHCGAHWCWGCCRRIDICNSTPCDGSWDDGYDGLLRDNMSDIDSVDDWTESNVPSRIQEDGDVITMMEVPTKKGPPMPDIVEHATDTASFVDAKGGGIEHPQGSQMPVFPAAMQNFMEIMDTVPIPLITSTPPLPESASPPPPLDHSDDDNDHDSTTPPQVISDTDASTDTPVTKSEEVEFINLDDPHSTAWDTTDFDFGDEPQDDDTLDIWGCVHSFEPAAYNKVPRHWMTASVPDWWDRAPEKREIDCMICWRATKLAPRPGEIEKLPDGIEKRKKIKDWRFARRCRNCSIVVCRKCRNELVKTDSW